MQFLTTASIQEPLTRVQSLHPLEVHYLPLSPLW